MKLDLWLDCSGQSHETRTEEVLLHYQMMVLGIDYHCNLAGKRRHQRGMANLKSVLRSKADWCDVDYITHQIKCWLVFGIMYSIDPKVGERSWYYINLLSTSFLFLEAPMLQPSQCLTLILCCYYKTTVTKRYYPPQIFKIFNYVHLENLYTVIWLRKLQPL